MSIAVFLCVEVAFWPILGVEILGVRNVCVVLVFEGSGKKKVGMVNFCVLVSFPRQKFADDDFSVLSSDYVCCPDDCVRNFLGRLVFEIICSCVNYSDIT